jgi:hypothetical protein
MIGKVGGRPMTEQTLQEDLMVVFVANSDGMFYGVQAQTFETIGVKKKGLFLTTSDGTEFSITINEGREDGVHSFGSSDRDLGK